MFVIKRETDLDVIRSLGCKETDLVMCVRENGVLTGHSRSEIDKELRMIEIVSEDDFMFDNLFRATLNYAAVHEIKSAVIDEPLFQRMQSAPTVPESREIDDCEVFLLTHRLCKHD